MNEFESGDLNRGREVKKVVTVQPRWKSWAMWVSVAGAVFTLLNVTGIVKIEQATWNAVLNALGIILTAFGIVNNPTNKSNF